MHCLTLAPPRRSFPAVRLAWAWLAAALAWGAHIAFDRLLGYGLRGSGDPSVADRASRPRAAGVLTARAGRIVSEARALLGAEGPGGLTMRRLAELLGMQAPSIYKHFPDKAALEAAVIASALEEQAALFEAALAGAPAEPLAALARAYRAHALAHPHLYRLVNARAAWAFAHGMVMLELDGRFPDGADLDAAWRVALTAFAAAVRS